MDLLEIFNMARELTGTNKPEYIIGSFSDEKLLKYVNLVYHDLENSIINQVNEDYFYNVYFQNLIAGQNIYTQEKNTSTNPGWKKVLRVEIKWLENQFYTKVVKNDDLTTYDGTNSSDFLADNLDKDNAFYEYKRGKIILYPTPTQNIVNGLKIYVVEALKDLKIGDKESDIFPSNSELRQYHHLLATGICPYIQTIRCKFNEKSVMQNDYIQEKNKLLGTINKIFDDEIVGETPNTFNFYFGH